MSNIEFLIANEGSFGAHPEISLSSTADELIMLISRKMAPN